MKNIVSNAKFFQCAPDRGPLRTLPEMAEEFGVTPKSLAGLLGHHNGPKPVMTSECKSTQKRNWYKPSEMRKWWKALKGAA